MPPRAAGPLIAFALFASARFAVAADVRVADSDALRRGCDAARPGDRILLAAGKYAPDVWIAGLRGTPGRPVTIEGDATDPPRFEGGREAIHIAGCAHVVIRNLSLKGQSANGLNIDDAGKIDDPAHHVVIERVVVEDTGAKGSISNAIKLSGVDDFGVRDCSAAGWSASAIDLVGCHRGVIEGCTFTGKEGFAAATGPQLKGGTSDVAVRRCSFDGPIERGVNAGGSTGTPYFRPRGAKYEARNITVEGCTFRGCTAPLAFPGTDGATVRYNTVLYPKKWLFRILQETRTPGFPPCRNVAFDHNLFVWNNADCPVPINVGDAAAPETFTFKDNWWFCADAPGRSRPKLPAPSTGDVTGRDPRATPDRSVPLDPSARGYGASAFRSPPTRPADEKR